MSKTPQGKFIYALKFFAVLATPVVLVSMCTTVVLM